MIYNGFFLSFAVHVVFIFILTLLHFLGTEEGIRLIESLKGVEAIFIARDRTVTCTSGAEYEWIK